MDIETFFQNQNNKKQLKILTCGSVDDGKSTLIGRLLFDSKNIYSDQLSQTKIESEKYGTQGKQIDLALLIDGLQAEREQGITIDVAYRYFETEKCKFIIADTPGHEEYTRNMVTGASNSDVGIILVDATKGILDQTKRHTFILSLLGIENIIVAVNKMDLINYDEKKFKDIIASFKNFAREFNFNLQKFIPISALVGDNVFQKNTNISWYNGKSLIDELEKISLKEPLEEEIFSLPVQFVNRSSSDFRGYSGTITSGKIKINDEVHVFSSKEKIKIIKILTPKGESDFAVKGQAVTLTLDKEVDISRGDLLCSVKNHNYFFASFIGFIPHFFIWNSIGAGINKFIKEADVPMDMPMALPKPDAPDYLGDDGMDYEGGMAKSQMLKMKKYAVALCDMIEDESQLESWVQAKLTKASDYMSSVYHYLDYQRSKMNESMINGKKVDLKSLEGEDNIFKGLISNNCYYEEKPNDILVIQKLKNC